MSLYEQGLQNLLRDLGRQRTLRPVVVELVKLLVAADDATPHPPSSNNRTYTAGFKAGFTKGYVRGLERARDEAVYAIGEVDK